MHVYLPLGVSSYTSAPCSAYIPPTGGQLIYLPLGAHILCMYISHWGSARIRAHHVVQIFLPLGVSSYLSAPCSAYLPPTGSAPIVHTYLPLGVSSYRSALNSACIPPTGSAPTVHVYGYIPQGVSSYTSAPCSAFVPPTGSHCIRAHHAVH